MLRALFASRRLFVQRHILHALLILLLVGACAGPAWAEDDDGLLPAIAAPGAPLVYWELHGKWRLRGHFLRDASLGNGTSGFPQTLSERSQNAENTALSHADDVALGDLRFRLQPQLHVGSRATISGQFDAVGAAMVLGDNPRDPTLLQRTLGFSGNGARQASFLVRRLWVDFDVFGLATLQIGKVEDHFGLGIHRNGGRNIRADFQSDIDRVGLRAELFGFRLMLARDILATMPRVARGLSVQDLDAGLLDGGDVIRWMAQMEAGAMEGPGFGWGLAVSYQDQGTALALETDADFSAELASGCIERATCTQVVPRDATLITPQGYVRYQRRTGLGKLTAEGEVTLIAGTIDNTEALVSTDTSKTVLAGGFAGRLSLANGASTWALSLGGASGDSEGGFGVLDQANLSVDRGGEREFRSFLTGFRFHRGFLVDALLFREVIGAVANAWYVKPTWKRQLATNGTFAGTWLQAGVLGAIAFSTGATPGRGRTLGIEPELLVGWDTNAGNSALLHASWLMPGSAFDAGQGGAAPTQAWRILAEWHVGF